VAGVSATPLSPAGQRAWAGECGCGAQQRCRRGKRREFVPVKLAAPPILRDRKLDLRDHELDLRDHELDLRDRSLNLEDGPFCPRLPVWGWRLRGCRGGGRNHPS
jgi:hypothetical protein